MAVIRFLTATKNSMLAELQADINAGATGGTIKMYTGSMPANPSVAPSASPTHKLLGTLVCSTDCGVVADGALTFNAITQDSVADDSGTATWARIADSDGNAVIDVDVTTTAGTGSLKMNTTVIVAGGPIAIASLVISIP